MICKSLIELTNVNLINQERTVFSPNEAQNQLPILFSRAFSGYKIFELWLDHYEFERAVIG